MKKLSASFSMVLSVELLLILIAFFVWDNVWNIVIFGGISVMLLLISLHKFGIIVLKDNNRQSLICDCWNYAVASYFVGYVLLFLEQILR